MRYSTEIKKFLYSQYFFGGLRTAIGISVPPLISILLFHDQITGFTVAVGAVAACVLDMPGPLKYKTNDMLACSLIGFLASLLTGLASVDALTLWLTVVPLTFVLSIIVVYGNKWQQISFAALFMMILTVGNQYSVEEATRHALWLLAGSLWYTAWSTWVSRWQWLRIERQAVAECIFATADYLRARGDLYNLDVDLAESYRQLVSRQIAAIDRQEAARDIVLRNLPQFRRGELDTQRIGLFNLFINAVDLHDTIVAAHVDHARLRAVLGRSDVMLFLRDAVYKIARDFEDIGLAVLEGQPSYPRVSVKAELRALEYEIELMRKHDAPARQPDIYSSVVSTYRRIWSGQRITERMHRNTRPGEIRPETEMRIDQALNRFLSGRRFSPGLILSNLTPSSPSFRHALRVTLAVAAGLWIGKLLPVNNGYWIVMTTVIILKPGFSLTRQRNTQRIIGTVIGCAASIGLILTVKSPHMLLAIMFGCMVMSYSLVLFNYTASVVFTSSWVLLLLHLIEPGGMRIVGERALDTFIGSALAVAASYLFPYWENRALGKLVQALIAAMRQYVDVAYGPLDGTPRPAPSPAAALTAAVSGIAAKDGALDGDYQYRLARKNVHIAFANLGNAFQRMMIEPKSQQRHVPELNDLLMQSHALAAQITAAAPLVSALAVPGRVSLLQPLQQAGASIRANLRAAEQTLKHADASDSIVAVEAKVVDGAGSGDATDAADATDATSPAPAPATPEADIAESAAFPTPEQERALTRALDEMVVRAEKAAEVTGTAADAAADPATGSSRADWPAEAIEELKLLAHQCKQMLAASSLVRRDTGKMRLPAS